MEEILLILTIVAIGQPFYFDMIKKNSCPYNGYYCDSNHYSTALRMSFAELASVVLSLRISLHQTAFASPNGY